MSNLLSKGYFEYNNKINYIDHQNYEQDSLI